MDERIPRFISACLNMRSCQRTYKRTKNPRDRWRANDAEKIVDKLAVDFNDLGDLKPHQENLFDADEER